MYFLHEKLSKEHISFLKQQELFKNINEEHLVQAITKTEDIHLLKGEVAFRKGEGYHKGIYFVIKGKISLSSANKNLIVSESDFIGLSTFLGKTIYTMDAIAETDCSLLFVDEFCIYRLMEYSPEFRLKLIDCIKNRLKDLGNNLNIFKIDSTFKSVGNCVSSPIITVFTGKTVQEAIRLMNKHSVSSLLVVTKKQNIKGLITVKNILSDFMTDLESNIKHPEIERYMNSNPIVFPPEYPIVEAIAKMEISSTTHALVEKDGKPFGIVSLDDLEKALFRNSTSYCTHIENISTTNELKNVFSTLYLVANNLATTARLSREVLSAIAAIHHSIHKKAFMLTSKEFIEKENFKLSDHRYCLLILGSGARREMDLSPQINYAIILDDEISQDNLEMFNKFLIRFTENLVTIGYKSPICELRATGKDFVMRYNDWISNIDTWTSKTSKIIKNCFSCAMDMTAFEGDITLSWSIRNYIFKKIADRPSIMAHLIGLYPPAKVPVSQFGSFIVEKDGENKGMFNLQFQGLHYLVNTTRLLSVYAGISDMGTVDRINHLARQGIIPKDMAIQTITAFDTIVETLISEQVNQAANNLPVTSYINPTSLSLFYQEKLKRALHFLTIYTSFATNLLKNV